MRKRTAALHNLGCKVNAYEAEKMTEKLKAAGYEIVPFDSPADFYIINTCSVTNIADRKSRQMINRARKVNPEAVVVASGCYVDTRGGEISADRNIDIAIPNSEKENIVQILEAWEGAHLMSEGEESITPAEAEGDRSRRFLKVQDGCNMFCSYCIIPYARGRVRSRPLDDVIKETEESVRAGFSEFVLTGIHLTSYEDLPGLIKAVDRVTGVKRIRLGSLEPTVVTEEFVSLLSGTGSICPHFHLSLQSGSDSVLKRMNRHYTAERFSESVSLLRRAFDDPAITTDVIVGFPGESEEEFEETARFLEEIKIYEAHIFPYSRRKGTVADRMPGQLSEREKHERLKILKSADEKRRRDFEDRHIRKEAEILIEDGNEGYTREYIRAGVKGDPIPSGTVLKGMLTGRDEKGRLEFRAD